jgi:hypothetical protein
LKAKLKKEGSELSEKIGQLKMSAEDGKIRITDIAATFPNITLQLFTINILIARLEFNIFGYV